MRFNICFYRDDEFGGGVEVTWEPAVDIRESKPYIVQIPKRKNRHDTIQGEKDYKKTNEALSKLGRKSLPFFSSSNSALRGCLAYALDRGIAIPIVLEKTMRSSKLVT